MGLEEVHILIEFMVHQEDIIDIGIIHVLFGGGILITGVDRGIVHGITPLYM